MLSCCAGLFLSGAAFSLFSGTALFSLSRLTGLGFLAGGFFSCLLRAFFSGAGGLFSLAGSLLSGLTVGAGFVLSIAGRKFLLDLSVPGSFRCRILHKHTAAAHFHLNGAGAARGVSLLDYGLFLAGNRNSAGLFRRLAAFLIRAL
ncbi:unknown [Sutterella sp. CAG:351]|nr:unknown [Sutterella sp. CAG:351]